MSLTPFRGYPLAPSAPADGETQINDLAMALDTDIANIDRGYRYSQTIYYTDYASPGSFQKAQFPGLRLVIVECVGGGGGSAYRQASSAAQGSVALGGWGGGYSLKRILAGALGSTETVTVGTPGTGATSAGSSGSNAGSSSFGAHCSASGGDSAVNTDLNTLTAFTQVLPGITWDAGVGSGGDINLYGEAPSPGLISTHTSYSATQVRISNGGKAPVYGSSIGPSSYVGNAGSVAGAGFGSGASGGAATGSASANNGADGSPGLVVVHVYV